MRLLAHVLNFFGMVLLHALWGSPSMTSTKRQPKKPRKPILFYAEGTVSDEWAAVVRFSWFANGQPRNVEEFALDPEHANEEGLEAFCNIVMNALHSGADVSVITPYDLEPWLPARPVG